MTTAQAWMLVVAPYGIVNASKLLGAVIVSVELLVPEPSAMEAGETLQIASGADPFTAQLSFTWPAGFGQKKAAGRGSAAHRTLQSHL